MPPTEAELKILNILWEQGACTVRQVHEALANTTTGYTTTLKQLQVMFEKALVERDDSSRSHVYSANVSQEKTQVTLIDKLLDTAFGGSTSQLFMRALNRRETSQKDLEQVRALLEALAVAEGKTDEQ